ncbi:hypothetical protein ACOSQ3_008841 [Xanthoceras sorbifolium]
MGNPHVLVIRFPGQGHVLPLMELSQWLAKHGIKITVANTEYNLHKLLVNALAKEEDDHQIANSVRLVTTGFGNQPETKIAEMLSMPAEKIKELINQINASSDGDKVTCVLIDTHLTWDMEIVRQMGIRRATFCAPQAAQYVLISSIPKLIEDGIPTKKQKFQFSPTMPAMNTSRLFWLKSGIKKNVEKYLFKHALDIHKSMVLTEWVLCNSTYDLEPAAFNMHPKILPIGPLLATNQSGNSAGNLFTEDLSCLKWLDQQAIQSVIYVAFGTFATFDQTQFQEFATGLELSNRPFLWVVCSDIMNKLNDAFIDGFQARVGARGLIISWAPQQKVLKHPSIACFFIHCGWNSTIEALSNGVPLLCWPFMFDQFYNENYICNVWEVGLGFDLDEGAIVTREEIENKVRELLGSEKYKANALHLKKKITSSKKEGGCSYKNFMTFVAWLKA